MSNYYKRIITYDDHTQNYKIEIPALGIWVLADTEASGLIMIREELELYAKRIGKVVQDTAALELYSYSEYQD